MSALPSHDSTRRGEHPYRRATLASEIVVARYLSDISQRRRTQHSVKSTPPVRPGIEQLAA
jgi:hypothetical protein